MNNSTTFHNARAAGPATAPSKGGGGKTECRLQRFHTPKTPQSGECPIGQVRTGVRGCALLNDQTHARTQRNGRQEGWHGRANTAHPLVGQGAEQVPA
jgi:hypothetical protein